jgi:hypothetical protein
MTHHHQAIKMLARNGWTLRHGATLVLALVISLLFTWPAWQQILWAALNDDMARPVVLVLPIMAWLVWVRRARFRFVKPGGWGVGLVLLLAGAQCYYKGMQVYDLRSVWRLGAVMIVAGAVLMVTGRSSLKHFLPAWFMLPFLVPVPATLATLVAQPLQLLEANFIASVYGLFGVAVQIIDAQGPCKIIIGGKTLPIESVCKGLPTMLSLLLICYGFVFGSPMRPVVRTVLLLIAPLVALLCSAIALGGTLWLYGGDATLMTADFIRAMSQWLTLLMAFLLIAGSVRLLAWASVPVHQYHLASTAP